MRPRCSVVLRLLMDLQLALLLITLRLIKESSARFLHDNVILDDPHIMCMEKEMGLAVQTQYPFFGRMFVNGMSDDPRCVRRFNSPHNMGQLMIPFKDCNMQSQRVLSPRPGMEHSAMIVVSFHSELLTETDKIFNVKCRYFEQDRSIGSFFQVSMLPTVMLTSSFPMPNCRYTLHVQGENGPEAQFARIGDPVYHRWQCDSDMYGMKVKSCFVDDGRKRRYQLLDAAGCANDKVILPDITYDIALNRAFAQTHVFKFADKPHVFFQCRITLCLKEAGACSGVTPPDCNSKLFKQHSQFTRYRRHLNGSTSDGAETSRQVGDMDVSSSSLVVLDLGDETKFDKYVEHKLVSDSFCVPKYGFVLLILANLLTLCIATFTSLALCRRTSGIKPGGI